MKIPVKDDQRSRDVAIGESGISGTVLASTSECQEGRLTGNEDAPESDYKSRITSVKQKEICQDLFAGLIFFGLSVWLFGRTVILDLSGKYLGWGSDPSQYIWALAWWPHALARHLNPFLVPVVWAPVDWNLAWFTSIPGPSLIMYPVTRFFGPVVSYNLWCVLAPAAAAWTAFILCRYMTQSFWPGLLGGYLFGFSSYIVGQLGHPDLVTVFPVPIVALLVLLKFNKAISSWLFVSALTVTLTFQFLSSPEVFATMTLFGAMAICLGVLIEPQWRAGFYSTLASISSAYLASCVILSPFLYYMLVPGEPAQLNSPLEYSTDLLNLVVPTYAWLGAHAFQPITVRFHGNDAENGAYLGLPLIIIIDLCARARWEQPGGKLLIYCFSIVTLASLGPRLHLAGAATIPLPWRFFQDLPLIDQALPARFVMYSSLVAGILAAMYVANADVNRLTRLVLAALAVLFIWPLSMPTTKVDTPNFFASGIYRRYFAANDTVVVLPFGNRGNSLLWQALTDMNFRMAGAYMNPPPSQSACWQVLTTFQMGHAVTDFPERLKLFLVANAVKAIVVPRHLNQFWFPLLATIDSSPISVSDVVLYRTPPPASGYSSLSPTDKNPLRLEIRARLRRYAELILAADKYATKNLPAYELTPWEAERLNLLSYDWEDGAPLDAPKESPWQGDLWLGPWGRRLAPAPHDGTRETGKGIGPEWLSQEVGVGMTGCPWVLESVVQKFGLYANTTYLPYPHLYESEGHKSKEFGQLLMVFTPLGLRDAAQAAKLLTATKQEGRVSEHTSVQSHE